MVADSPAASSRSGVAMVVGSDNKVAQRVLTTGDAIGDKWVVRQGLKAGDKVIVQGLQKASVGAEVRAVEVSQTAAADSAANASPSTQGTAAAAPKADPEAGRIATLTAREREVIGMIVHGKGALNKDLAEKAFI